MNDFNAPPTGTTPPTGAPPAGNFDPMAYIQSVTPAPSTQAPPAPSTQAPPAPNTNQAPWWSTPAPTQQPVVHTQAPAPANAGPSFTQTQQQVSPWFDPTAVRDYGLTPEEAARFAQSIPVIDRVVNAKLVAMEASLRGRVGDIASKFEARIGQSANDAELVFASQVDSAIGDLPVLTSDPRWAQYLAYKPPMAGRPVQSIIAEAYANRDLATLTEIANNFREKVGAQPQAHQLPSTTTTYSNINPAAQPQKPVLPLSAHTRATQDFVRGRITKAQFDSIDAQYIEADRERRVDYNA